MCKPFTCTKKYVILRANKTLMVIYSSELLHISCFVIGILLGALICAIGIIFYYRKKLRTAHLTDDDLLLFSDLDSQEETIGYLEATPTREDADNGDAAGLEDEQPEENESGRGLESEIREKDESVKEIEEEKPEAEASEEEPSSELFHSPLPNRRATKAEAAEEQLYQQVTAAIVEEQLFLKPGFGRANIVERFGISAHRAGMIFSKHQTSIPEFVRNCRLDYACQQMKDDPLTNLSDIAAASGFNYVSSFMRDFKDRYGVTPARFREMQQAKVDDDEKMLYRNNDINK